MEPLRLVSVSAEWVSWDQTWSLKVCKTIQSRYAPSPKGKFYCPSDREQLPADYVMIADIVPVVMAGIIGIYGLVVSVLVANNLKQELALFTGFIQLGAGLSVGLAGLAAGYVLRLLESIDSHKD